MHQKFNVNLIRSEIKIIYKALENNKLSFKFYSYWNTCSIVYKEILIAHPHNIFHLNINAATSAHNILTSLILLTQQWEVIRISVNNEIDLLSIIISITILFFVLWLNCHKVLMKELGRQSGLAERQWTPRLRVQCTKTST